MRFKSERVTRHREMRESISGHHQYYCGVRSTSEMTFFQFFYVQLAALRIIFDRNEMESPDAAIASTVI